MDEKREEELKFIRRKQILGVFNGNVKWAESVVSILLLCADSKDLIAISYHC